MTHVAWPDRAVRPYESLLILVRRFLWLNKPQPSELAHSLEIAMGHLIRLDLIFRRVGGQRMELSLLRRLLQMDALEWSGATLDWNTLGNQTFPDMRFCPKCLERGYHTAIFQLRTVTVCPEHRCELISGCPQCGGEMPTVLTGKVFRSPFTCLRCGWILVNSKTLIDLPPVDSLPEIARIADWYRWAAELPRIETIPWVAPEKGKAFANTPVWMLLEFAGGKQAPKLVNLDKARPAGTLARGSTCGLRVAESDRTPRDERMVPLSEKDLKRFTLYRSYRRHLQKRLPPGVLRLVRDFHRLDGNREHTAASLRISEASQEVKTLAVGLLLFLHTMEHCHCLDTGLFRHTNSIPSVPDGINGSTMWRDTRRLSVHRSDSFRCSSVEQQWFEDHVSMEGIRCIFETALCHAREMVRSGYYFLVDVSDLESVRFPFFLGMLDGTDRLKLWSLKSAVDSSDCRRLQTEWMTSPTASILYEESPMTSESRNFSGASPRPARRRRGLKLVSPAR